MGKNAKQIFKGSSSRYDLEILERTDIVEITTTFQIFDGAMYEEKDPPAIVRLISACNGVKKGSVSIEKCTIEIGKEKTITWKKLLPSVAKIIQQHAFERDYSPLHQN